MQKSPANLNLKRRPFLQKSPANLLFCICAGLVRLANLKKDALFFGSFFLSGLFPSCEFAKVPYNWK